MKDKLKDYSKYQHLTYEDFKRLAVDDSLSKYEKIGVPDELRKDFEEAIFKDIIDKLPILQKKNQTILDLGCGCSGLISMLIDHCEQMDHKLILVDSPEMLALVPDKEFITKVEGKFPDNVELLDKLTHSVNVILCYSVLHQVHVRDNIFDFIDKALEFLAEEGMFLIGDIPNISKRNRYFSSEQGVRYHKNFTGKQDLPEVNHYQIESYRMDDGIIFAILQRYRNFGFETYLLPQNNNLPMYGRREDILIVRW